jgi:hypothetical protein
MRTPLCPALLHRIAALPAPRPGDLRLVPARAGQVRPAGAERGPDQRDEPAGRVGLGLLGGLSLGRGAQRGVDTGQQRGPVGRGERADRRRVVGEVLPRDGELGDGRRCATVRAGQPQLGPTVRDPLGVLFEQLGPPGQVHDEPGKRLRVEATVGPLLRGGQCRPVQGTAVEMADQ